MVKRNLDKKIRKTMKLKDQYKINNIKSKKLSNRRLNPKSMNKRQKLKNKKTKKNQKNNQKSSYNNNQKQKKEKENNKKKMKKKTILNLMVNRVQTKKS